MPLQIIPHMHFPMLYVLKYNKGYILSKTNIIAWKVTLMMKEVSYFYLYRCSLFLYWVLMKTTKGVDFFISHFPTYHILPRHFYVNCWRFVETNDAHKLMQLFIHIKKLHLIIIICLIIRQDLKNFCGDSVCFVFNQYYSSEKGESLCDWIFVNTSNEEEKGEISLCLYVKHKIV